MNQKSDGYTLQSMLSLIRTDRHSPTILNTADIKQRKFIVNVWKIEQPSYVRKHQGSKQFRLCLRCFFHIRSDLRSEDFSLWWIGEVSTLKDEMEKRDENLPIVHAGFADSAYSEQRAE
ncbi:hypothetical protein H920_15520 [Fukomys damarensis]|uniref:Uncharacterized protein n=1 Tax=Fukomys damarensis TaxID=885580 RepID=A0A091CYY4_FUKDA|nr:hypothetical protein H920_15520 [Fukomys damarensis]